MVTHSPAKAITNSVDQSAEVRLPDLVDSFRQWLATSVLSMAEQATRRGATLEAARLLADNAALFQDGDEINVLQVRLDRLNELHSPATAQANAPAHTGIQCLTPRERDVARLIARGLTNKQIAHELVISRGTVMVHIKHILARLGMASRTQVAAWYAQHADSR
jgi:DNA-binding NarL/FixJ family response regulator